MSISAESFLIYFGCSLDRKIVCLIRIKTKKMKCKLTVGKQKCLPKTILQDFATNKRKKQLKVLKTHYLKSVPAHQIFVFPLGPLGRFIWVRPLFALAFGA